MSDADPAIRVQVREPVAAEPLVVLSCIGCGAIEVPHECTGACRDRRLDLVHPADYERARTTLTDARARAERLRGVTLAVAEAAGADGDWEAMFHALQRDARAALRTLAEDRPPPDSRMPAEPVAAWCCETCGRIEAPQPCIGVCVRRPTEMLAATDYDALVAEAAAGRGEEETLLALVRRLAWLRPRPGTFEAACRALQGDARAIATPAT